MTPTERRTEVVISSPVGFVDLFLRGECLGHDPRPCLEWNNTVVLNGERVDVIDCSQPEYLVVRAHWSGQQFVVRRSDIEAQKAQGS